MSGLDQPLLIATSGYHVGHQRSIRVAEEMGYFIEEGLESYVYDYRGLIPGPLEQEGLALAMKEHGVDIVAGATTEAVIIQRSRGADLLVVGGWRYVTKPKIVSAKNIRTIADLRGKRIGLRERGSLTDRLIIILLIQAGVDPEREVEWVLHPSFAYPSTSEHADLLRDGRVDAISTAGPFLDDLLQEGYHLLIDGDAPERRRKPGRVIAATRQTVEKRGDELTAFLKGNLRGCWVWSDPTKFDYLYECETRMRQNFTHNEHERTLRVVKTASATDDTLMPPDGKVDRDGLRAAIEEMQLLGELRSPVAVEQVLRAEFMDRGFAELCARPSLQPTIERIQASLAAT